MPELSPVDAVALLRGPRPGASPQDDAVMRALFPPRDPRQWGPMTSPFEAAAERVRRANPVAPKPSGYAEGLDALGSAGADLTPAGIALNLARASPAIYEAGRQVAGALSPTSEAEAAPRLTREQQQALEVERQRAAIAREAEQARGQSGLEVDRQRQQDALEAERQRREAEVKFAREREAADSARRAAEEKTRAEAPFAKRYPALAEALPAVGAAAAGLIPYAGRVGNVVLRNAATRPWTQAVARGEEALASGDAGARAASRGELRALSRTPPPEVAQTSPWLPRAGAAAGVESALVAPEYNAAMLPADSPDKWPDPRELAVRLLMAGAAGSAPALVGSYLPVPLARPEVPAARVEGLLGSLRPAPANKSRRPARGAQ